MGNGRPPVSPLPTDSTPSVADVSRRVLTAVQGQGGQFFGPHWRALEQPYPGAHDQVCLVFQYNGANGWKTVFVVKPDGTQAGVT